MRDAVLAEFSSAEALVAAIHAMREAGQEELDAFTPYPLHEVEHALGLRRSRLPQLCAAVGFTAAAGAYLLQWLLNAYLYPLNVGGRPPHFPLAFVIITFEMGVLFAGATAFLGVLGLSRLPTLWRPVDEIDGFQSATDNRYWLVVKGKDARDRADATRDQLSELSPERVVTIRSGRVL